MGNSRSATDVVVVLVQSNFKRQGFPLCYLTRGLRCSVLQGEVYICGKKREGLISDQGDCGLRIGLVSVRVHVSVCV